MLLPTTLVGSYAQPEWLIDRAKLASRFPPRVRAKELWRIPEPWLAEAQDDATILAIKAQEEAGIDIVTDGEIRRESYSNRFATALEGIDIDNPGVALDRSGHPNPVPRIVGKIRRKHAVEVEDLKFLRRHTDRKVKMTVPGPFTMSQQAQNDFYPSAADAAMDYAAAVNAEIKDLFAAGADVVQIDEPYMQARPAPAGEYGLAALNRALEGVEGVTAVHICFGYAAIIHQRPSAYSFLTQLKDCRCKQISIETAQSNLDCAVLKDLPDQKIILGVLDLSTPEVETPETVASRIRRALGHRKPEDIIVAPDCGLKYLPRDSAFGKMKAMAEGARLARRPNGELVFQCTDGDGLPTTDLWRIGPTGETATFPLPRENLLLDAALGDALLAHAELKGGKVLVSALDIDKERLLGRRAQTIWSIETPDLGGSTTVYAGAGHVLARGVQALAAIRV